MTNPYGWNLPLTDDMLDTSPYAPLDSPEQNIAERLVMLAHLSYDSKVWGSRLPRYWGAFAEHVESSTNNPDVASWWGALERSMPLADIRNTMLVHEKNLLCHPTKLPGTPVQDGDVLMVLRTYTSDLKDRTRVWAKVRRDARKALEELGEDDL